MEYEKKYKEAQGWIEKIYPTLQHEQQMEAEAFFPELKESEDEKIRKWLISQLKIKSDDTNFDLNIMIDKAISWLEKQGEHNHIDKIEPKFKVCDVMRTLQEAANNITSGLPVVVSIDEEYYHCTNELIAIKDQDDYEYPPMNRAIAWSEEDEKRLQSCINILKAKSLMGKVDTANTMWIKSLKQRIGG